MKHGESFNSSQRIVYVRKGYVRDQDAILHPPGSTIAFSEKIKSEGNATIMYQSHVELYFYQGAQKISETNDPLPDDFLKKVK